MKKIISLIAFILLNLSAAGFNPEPAADKIAGLPAAHLSPDSLSLDLGRISPDTIASGIIRFRNTGTAPLQILSIFTDCGCTTTSYTVDPLAPGEEGEIKISFNPKGRRPGSFRKALRIRSNADNPRETLSVKGMIGSGKHSDL